MLIHHNWLPRKWNFAQINTKEIRKTTALLKKKNWTLRTLSNCARFIQLNNSVMIALLATVPINSSLSICKYGGFANHTYWHSECMIFVLVVEAIIKSQVALQSPTPQIFIYNPNFSAHYWCCWITKLTSRLFLKEDYCPLVSYKWQEAECAQYPINYNSDEILCKFRMSWNMPTHFLIVSDAVPGKFVWTCKLFMMAVSSVSFL